MKRNNKIFLFLLFLLINVSVYFLNEMNSKHKIDIVLQSSKKTLKTHYEILLETQRTTARAIYDATLQLPGLIEIMAEASGASKEKKVELRKKFHNVIQPFYKIIKKKGVLQYQFLFKNNISFYRAHKPSKFADDLTDVRIDFKYVNEMKKPIRGFVQGRVAHGFRNTFPIFDENNNHIGAMEVSFSSDAFQWYLNEISHIHSHFLVSKNIFNSKTWKRDDLVLKYEQSVEAADYMITLNSTHSKKDCIDKNRIKLSSVREEIDSKILLGDSFSLYIKNNEVEVISFLPIKNIEHETVAWIVSYENNPIIYWTLLNGLIVEIIAFFFSLLTVYFLAKQILSKQKIEAQKIDIQKQHKFLNDILNSTDNIMFITDFKDVKFFNNKFKDFINIKNVDLFNALSNHTLLDIFTNRDGYLHKKLLKENENFLSLISRTPIKDRVVSIEDKNFVQVDFKISISKSENIGDYLVTLSDITQMKKHQVQTEKKAYLDSLTKIYNRSRFDEILKQELITTKRYKHPFTLAILDIDRFKVFNDTYGHLIGDEVLISTVKVIKRNLRDSDVFARWGGEEFIILFKNTTIDKARTVSEKLKDKLASSEHPIAGRITASFGLTEYIHNDTPKSIFQRCDDALFLAKENGRNRIEVL